ncbi:type I phosphomannose isomerase catalytic subunit [Marispirochaeta aestuarii]|uniref:type I phosphomannose isomerase catalytic subunit n=1 Tax=Marispirochaeta aestuarii TaxID=1963862 RepID=UPI0029C78A9C|nr:type I phosphomannose isomerase catalytic subunit [Marispirochaeta aestuarii]
MTIAEKPLAVDPTRVWRTYVGGRILDTVYGKENPGDGEFPESWLASVVSARNPGREHIDGEGLSFVSKDAGTETKSLKSLIEQDPAAFLGKRHVDRFGSDPALLVKLIDSAERLTIQAHPTRKDSLRYFNSPFGKSEFWVILGGREIDGQKPYVLFGFKPGITREKWRRLFEAQDIQGMIDALHKIPVQPGDVMAVPGGVPHAIGPGCFLLEAQEPTDFTLRPERITPKGRVLPEEACHLGAGFESMLDMFDYTPYTPEELRGRFIGSCPLDESGETCLPLTVPAMGMPFRVNYHAVPGKGELNSDGGFAVVLCLEGEGSLGGVPVGPYTALFVPAGALNRVIETSSGKPLKLLECLPEAT